MRTKAILIALTALAVVPADATRPRYSDASSAAPRPANVQIEMKNVRLHVADGIVLDVDRLRGTMVSRSENPPVFDNQQSYVLDVATGSVSMDMTSLQNLMNRYAFAYDGAPLRNLKVRAANDRLEMSGKLRKGIEVPFSTKATVGVTADGRLRLHAESMKAAGIPAKGLLKLFGLELDDVMNLKQRRGMDVEDNDIVISPGQVLPPPEMRGRLTSAVIRNNRLVQTFGTPGGKEPAPLKRPSPSARNYIYFGTGEIRFGKLTMHDADLQLIDSDPRDPFDFFPARYKAQLIAGYSKNTPQHGLKTYMPDFDDLSRH
jgi:hypothetical protein